MDVKEFMINMYLILRDIALIGYEQVEVNDAVTVAGMTRPKQLPNELLSDLAVSTATKLQCYRVTPFFRNDKIFNATD